MKRILPVLLFLASCADGSVKMIGPGAKDCRVVVEYGGMYSGAIVVCEVKTSDGRTCIVAEGIKAIAMDCRP